jgi:hypothetical protein
MALQPSLLRSGSCSRQHARAVGRQGRRRYRCERREPGVEFPPQTRLPTRAGAGQLGALRRQKHRPGGQPISVDGQQRLAASVRLNLSNRWLIGGLVRVVPGVAIASRDPITKAHGREPHPFASRNFNA